MNDFVIFKVLSSHIEMNFNYIKAFDSMGINILSNVIIPQNNSEFEYFPKLPKFKNIWSESGYLLKRVETHESIAYFNISDSFKFGIYNYV